VTVIGVELASNPELRFAYLECPGKLVKCIPSNMTQRGAGETSSFTAANLAHYSCFNARRFNEEEQ